MNPLVFLSYARRDAGPEFDRFEQELRRALADRDLGFGPTSALFRDQRSIPTGYRWSAALDHALATCQAFLPLLSPNLFASAFCGKEWAAQAQRGLVPVPVVWEGPAQGPFDGFPACVREVQLSTLGAFEHRAGLEPYLESGARALFESGEMGEGAAEVITWIADQVGSRSKAPPPPAVPGGGGKHFRVKELPNAFRVPAGGLELAIHFRVYLGGLLKHCLPLQYPAVFFDDEDKFELQRVYTPLNVETRVRPTGGTPAGARISVQDGLRTVADLHGDEAAKTRLDERLHLEAEAGLLEEVGRVEQAADGRAEARGEPGEEPESGGRRDGKIQGRRLRALEAAALNRKLVLLGDPGSGKSTFGRYLALCHAGALRGRAGPDEPNLDHLNRLPGELDIEAEEQAPWPHGPHLPILVELGRFSRSKEFPSSPGEAGVTCLLAWLERHPKCAMSDGEIEALRDRLNADSDEPRLLVILDGLDETDDNERVRATVRALVKELARRRCRILLTARPYSYTPESPWRLEPPGAGAGAGHDDGAAAVREYPDFQLAPLEEAEVANQARSWFREAARVGGIGEDEAEDVEKRFLAEFRRARDEDEADADTDIDARRATLFTNPLNLRMMLGLAQRRSFLSRDRTELFRKSTEIYINAWNKAKDEREDEDGEPGATAADLLGVSVLRLRDSLARLAFDVQSEKGAGAEFTMGRLFDAMDEELPDLTAFPKPAWNLLKDRYGILIPLSAQRPEVRFATTSHQEYLAGCHARRVPDELRERLAGEDWNLWRQVGRFAASEGAPDEKKFWEFLRRLVPAFRDSDVDHPDHLRVAARTTLLTALSLRETRHHRECTSDDGERFLRELQQHLSRILERGLLEPADRLLCGQVLARIGLPDGGGDPRRGVATLTDGRLPDLPDGDWIPIEPGVYEVGEGDRRHRTPSLEPFRIYRYPVTVAHYQAFVDAGGYSDPGILEDCWTEAGRDWRKEQNVTGPYRRSDAHEVPNVPRSGVSWYEAHAFTAWLSRERKGRGQSMVRLPSEHEWEAAARGRERREYPWGDVWDESHCNSEESGLGVPSPVGMYPTGATPEGILDLGGNVWEWCRTRWKEEYAELTDEDENEEGSAVRVLRGGSSFSARHDVRGAFRRRIDPRNRYWNYGFRVVSPSS